MDNDIKEGSDNTFNDEIASKIDEINTKYSSQSQQLEQLMNMQQQLVSQIQAANQDKEEMNYYSDSEDLESLIISNPAEAIKRISETVKKEVTTEINTNNYTNQVLTNLYSEYPELKDDNSDLTKKALQIHALHGEGRKKDPIAIKASVHEAALELGLLPTSKRKSQSSDEYTFGASNNNRREKSSKTKVNDLTLAAAEAFGLDINDKAVVERLNKHSQRNFRKYE
ncbi:MAG: hypothetical protein GTN36_05450 [Candidatus Aenigmarchaeota archaeon]|nr:hypothetical protein [Candidatus Aenigmarchaeota archaeon]